MGWEKEMESGIEKRTVDPSCCRCILLVRIAAQRQKDMIRTQTVRIWLSMHDDNYKGKRNILDGDGFVARADGEGNRNGEYAWMSTQIK